MAEQIEPKKSGELADVEAASLLLGYQYSANCPNCGAESKFHEVRDYSAMWHDGDVYCLKCGSYVRRYDADI